MVKMMRPRTVEQASESARLQETLVEVMMKKQRQQQRGMVLGISNVGGKNYNQEVMKGKQVGGSSSVPYEEQLGEQRRLAGLCFRCGDKYYQGHQCKRQILLLEGDEEEDQGETGEVNPRRMIGRTMGKF